MRRWTAHLLRLYPRAWRDRYGAEVAELLGEHKVTLWTAVDMLLGALDAHLHADLLPGRLLSMTHRLRSSEIAVFCGFVVFCVAWLPLTLVRDPLPVWQSAVGLHPELRSALDLLDLAGLVATVAVLAGGVPILLVAIVQAVRARSRRLLLLALPVLATVAYIAFVIFALPASVSKISSAPGAPLTPLAVALQLIVVVLLLAVIGGSTAALAVAVAHTELGARLLRLALLPAGIVTLALAGGLFAGLALTVLIFTEAPQVSLWPPLHVVDLLLMLLALVLAIFGLQRGLQATRTSAAGA